VNSLNYEGKHLLFIITVNIINYNFNVTHVMPFNVKKIISQNELQIALTGPTLLQWLFTVSVVIIMCITSCFTLN